MTQSVSVSSNLTAEAAEVIEHNDGRHQWRIVPSCAAILESSHIDWFYLENEPGATQVKRNSHRDVWRVMCGGRAFFAKLYHPRGLAARAKLLLRGPTAFREWGVSVYAAEHSIATAVPVATAWCNSRRKLSPSLLITEAIADVEPLNDCWLRIRDDRVLADSLLEELARLIARAHQCGFQHGDMHPGNILARRVGGRSEVFFVDLHNVRIGRPVSPHEAIANLAQLNQWFRRHATRMQRRRFLAHYMAYRDRFAQASPLARNWRPDPARLIADLARQAERHANKLWAKRDRRAQRTGRYFARITPARGWRGHVLLRSKHPSPSACAACCSYTKEQWRQWLRNPLDWVDPARQELLKDSHTATICRGVLDTASGTVSVIVKRPLARSFWKRLRQMFGPSRNRRSWKMANMLLNRALPAAQPLAIVERRALGVICLDSIAFLDYVPNSVDLETFLTKNVAALEPARQRSVKDRLIESLVSLVRAFHERGFVHRDFKAPNLLVSWEPPYDSPPVLTFIDMDGITHVRRVGEKHRSRSLVRLCASLLSSSGCTRTDRLRFLKRSLIAPGQTASGWKSHWRAIQAAVSGKVQDKEARRQWKLRHYGRE